MQKIFDLLKSKEKIEKESQIKEANTQLREAIAVAGHSSVMEMSDDGMEVVHRDFQSEAIVAIRLGADPTLDNNATLLAAVRHNHPTLVNLLINDHAVKEIYSKKNKTEKKNLLQAKYNALMLAIKLGHTNIAKYLLKDKMLTNDQRSAFKNDAFIEAIKYGRMGIFDFLNQDPEINKNRNPKKDKRYENGIVCLIGAARYGRPRMAKILLKDKKINLKSNDYVSLREAARQWKRYKDRKRRGDDVRALDCMKTFELIAERIWPNGISDVPNKIKKQSPCKEAFKELANITRNRIFTLFHQIPSNTLEKMQQIPADVCRRIISFAIDGVTNQNPRSIEKIRRALMKSSNLSQKSVDKICMTLIKTTQDSGYVDINAVEEIMNYVFSQNFLARRTFQHIRNNILNPSVPRPLISRRQQSIIDGYNDFISKSKDKYSSKTQKEEKVEKTPLAIQYPGYDHMHKDDNQDNEDSHTPKPSNDKYKI